MMPSGSSLVHLLMGATMVKYGLDKRIGMLVMNLSGTKVRNVVLGILVGTVIPSAFISEASIAPMFLPIAMALYTLTSKKLEMQPSSVNC